MNGYTSYGILCGIWQTLSLLLFQSLLVSPKTCCVKQFWRERGESVNLKRQVPLSWGASALMREDAALTEAACPPSKSNYDNHASGKPAATGAARQALIQQAVYLNHSSPLLQSPVQADVDSLKESVRTLSDFCTILCWDSKPSNPQNIMSLSDCLFCQNRLQLLLCWSPSGMKATSQVHR